MSTPVTPDEHRAIIATLTETENVRETARIHGRGPSTISRIAKAEGIEPAARPRTKRARDAKRVDNASRRAALVSGLLDDAERLRSQLFAPTTVFNFGGKENTYAERVIPEPTFADKRHIAGAVRMLLTTAIDLERVDHQGEDFGAVDAWLRSIVGEVVAGGEAA